MTTTSVRRPARAGQGLRDHFERIDARVNELFARPDRTPAEQAEMMLGWAMSAHQRPRLPWRHRRGAGR